jgi:hypothetical protein
MWKLLISEIISPKISSKNKLAGINAETMHSHASPNIAPVRGDFRIKNR